MHIHGGQLNANLSASSAHASQAALAAQRAEATRKKLFEAAAQVSAETDSAWMIQAWAGDGSPNGSPNSSLARSAGQDNAQQSHVGEGSMEASTGTTPDVPRTPRSGPVSFWA